MQGGLRELCEDTHGRRVLLHLLRSEGARKLAPSQREVLQPPTKLRTAVQPATPSSGGDEPASEEAPAAGVAKAASQRAAAGGTASEQVRCGLPHRSR